MADFTPPEGVRPGRGRAAAGRGGPAGDVRHRRRRRPWPASTRPPAERGFFRALKELRSDAIEGQAGGLDPAAQERAIREELASYLSERAGRESTISTGPRRSAVPEPLPTPIRGASMTRSDPVLGPGSARSRCHSRSAGPADPRARAHLASRSRRATAVTLVARGLRVHARAIGPAALPCELGPWRRYWDDGTRGACMAIRAEDSGGRYRTASLVILAVLATIAALYLMKAILIPIALALVLACLLSPGDDLPPADPAARPDRRGGRPVPADPDARPLPRQPDGREPGPGDHQPARPTSPASPGRRAGTSPTCSATGPTSGSSCPSPGPSTSSATATAPCSTRA